MNRWSPGYGTLAVAFVLALVPPLLGISDFYIHLMVLMVIYAIFAMSLDLMMGYGGLPSLGHAAFFGLGAYGVGIAIVKLGLNWWQGTLIGLAACFATAVLFGLVALRTRGLYFLLITLALGQLLWGAVNRWGSFTGGFNGLPGIPRPAHWLASTSAYYYLSLGLLVALSLFMQRLVNSPFGLALRAVSDSESRASAIGFNAWLHLYAAFLIGSMIAGIAGVLNVFYGGFVSPHDLSISMSAEAILMVILGGTRTLWGPVIGAIVIVTLRNVLSVYFNHWLIILGGIFIVVVLLAPNGIAGLFGQARAVTPEEEQPPAPLPHLTDEIKSTAWANTTEYSTALAVENLSKSFGGVRAVSDVTFAAATGTRLALLGPNGAGKTTLFQIISGAFAPDEGRIRLFGIDLAGISDYRRARMGIGRTFQITNLFPSLTVANHLRLCALSLFRLRFDIVRHASKILAVEAFVEESLKSARIAHLRSIEVRNLSYGHQRQVEVAMAMAMRPKVLLLDEPAAGLSMAEIGPIIDTIRALDRSVTVILVEHDMDVVFALADRVVVFHHGELLAEGTSEEIRKNAEVNRIYLGRSTT